MDARADILSYIVESIEVTDMSNGTATFKFNFDKKRLIPAHWGVSSEVMADILSEGSMKLLAEAMIWPVELDIFAYNEERQEAKGIY